VDELLASAVVVIDFILTLLAPLFPMTEVAVGLQKLQQGCSNGSRVVVVIAVETLDAVADLVPAWRYKLKDVACLEGQRDTVCSCGSYSRLEIQAERCRLFRLAGK